MSSSTTGTTRLSSVGRTPVADRIKIFDNSPKSIKTPPISNKLGNSPPSPPNVVLKPVTNTTASKSQFSTKDPTNIIGGNMKQNNSNGSSSKASSRADLSRTSSNASTKSGSTGSSASRSSPRGAANSSSAMNGAVNSPAAGRKSVSGSSGGGRSVARTNSVKSMSNGKSGGSPPSASQGGGDSLSRKSSAAKQSEPSADQQHGSLSRKSSSGVGSRAALRSPPLTATDTAGSIDSVDRAAPPSVAIRSTSIVSRKSSSSSVVSTRTSTTTNVFELNGSKVNGEISAHSSRKTSSVEERQDVSETGSFDSNPEVDNTTADSMHFNNNNNMGMEANSILASDKQINQDSLLTKDEKTNGSGYWSTKASSNPTMAKLNKVNQHKAMRLDVELRDERISGLQRELEEMTANGSTQDELKSLKKLRVDMEMKVKEQEDDIEDLNGQVQSLEGVKARLEQQIVALKKEHRRELQSKDDELEDVRAAATKKVKVLEQQLEQEHEERLVVVREKHDLDGKIMSLQDMLHTTGDQEQVGKLRRDLKRTKALLRDAQTMLDKAHTEGTSKVILRQLKNQLEDAEFARTAAMKARQNSELELADVHTQLEDISRSKQDLEDRYLRVNREKAELATHLQETEEELQDVMKKYKASVAALSTDQITIQDQQTYIQELEEERNKLRENVAELSSKLNNIEGENVSTAQHKRLELKMREMESKLELEATTRSRLENTIIRLKETIEKVHKECDDFKIREENTQEMLRKATRSARDLKEELTTVQGKETDLLQKKGELERQLEIAETENSSLKGELKQTLKRLEDLQVAIAGDILDASDDHSNSDDSDDDLSSLIEQHRLTATWQKDRTNSVRVSRETLSGSSSLAISHRSYNSLDDSNKDSITDLDESQQ